jgi:hypothetical protein
MEYSKGIIGATLNLEKRMDTPVTETPKKNQTPLIIAAVAIVLCCCCVALAAAGYYFFSVNRSTTQVEPIEDATPAIPDDSQLPTAEPDFTDIGEAPTGGLGNEILRNDTWQYVALAAQGQGCDQPLGADTQIEVLQEPANDTWVEKWTVACASGDSYPYEVEFILDDTGTTFNIKSLP